MQWKINTPKLEDVRLLTRFAIIPTKIDNCYVWLETYTLVQRYCIQGWQTEKRVKR